MRKRILLVDDTQTVLAVERLILGPTYDYVEARNGEEALARTHAEAPDLILLDLNMPVMNGVQCLRALKGDAATAGIPVVIVTTRGEDAAQATCRSLGCADFITKPLDRQVLQSTVTRLIGS